MSTGGISDGKNVVLIEHCRKYLTDEYRFAYLPGGGDRDRVGRLSRVLEYEQEKIRDPNQQERQTIRVSALEAPLMQQLCIGSRRRIFITGDKATGDGGSGKSQFTRALAFQVATQAIDDLQSHRVALIPIRYELKNLEPAHSLFERIQIGCGARWDVSVYAKSGQVLFILDGLDEITRDTATYFENRLSDFVNSAESCPILIAGREGSMLSGWSSTLGLTSRDTHRLQPLSNEQIQAFIFDYFAKDRHRAEELIASLDDVSRQLLPLLRQPFMLAMACYSVDQGDLKLPATTAEFMLRGLMQLLSRRSFSNRALPPDRLMRTKPADALEHLQRLAAFACERDFKFTADDDQFDALFASTPLEDLAPASGILTMQGDGKAAEYSFTNRVIAEYLAGSYIAASGPPVARDPDYTKAVGDSALAFYGRYVWSDSKRNVLRWMLAEWWRQHPEGVNKAERAGRWLLRHLRGGEGQEAFDDVTHTLLVHFFDILATCPDELLERDGKLHPLADALHQLVPPAWPFAHLGWRRGGGVEAATLAHLPPTMIEAYTNALSVAIQRQDSQSVDAFFFFVDLANLSGATSVEPLIAEHVGKALLSGISNPECDPRVFEQSLNKLVDLGRFDQTLHFAAATAIVERLSGTARHSIYDLSFVKTLSYLPRPENTLLEAARAALRRERDSADRRYDWDEMVAPAIMPEPSQEDIHFAIERLLELLADPSLIRADPPRMVTELLSIPRSSDDCLQRAADILRSHLTGSHLYGRLAYDCVIAVGLLPNLIANRVFALVENHLRHCPWHSDDARQSVWFSLARARLPNAPKTEEDIALVKLRSLIATEQFSHVDVKINQDVLEPLSVQRTDLLGAICSDLINFGQYAVGRNPQQHVLIYSNRQRLDGMAEHLRWHTSTNLDELSHPGCILIADTYLPKISREKVAVFEAEFEKLSTNNHQAPQEAERSLGQSTLEPPTATSLKNTTAEVEDSKLPLMLEAILLARREDLVPGLDPALLPHDYLYEGDDLLAMADSLIAQATAPSRNQGNAIKCLYALNEIRNEQRSTGFSKKSSETYTDRDDWRSRFLKDLERCKKDGGYVSVKRIHNEFEHFNLDWELDHTSLTKALSGLKKRLKADFDPVAQSKLFTLLSDLQIDPSTTRDDDGGERRNRPPSTEDRE